MLKIYGKFSFVVIRKNCSVSLQNEMIKMQKLIVKLPEALLLVENLKTKMAKSHIEKLKLELEKSKWIIRSEIVANDFLKVWEISRPNGDCLLKIDFSIFGNGKHGDCIGNETMDNTIGCSIIGHSEIDIYFGKYSEQFRKDLIKFIFQLNELK